MGADDIISGAEYYTKTTKCKSNQLKLLKLSIEDFKNRILMYSSA